MVQEGSVTRECLCTKLDKLARGKSVARRTDRLAMTIAVDWDIKPQTKPKSNRGQRLPPKNDNYIFRYIGYCTLLDNCEVGVQMQTTVSIMPVVDPYSFKKMYANWFLNLNTCGSSVLLSKS